MTQNIYQNISLAEIRPNPLNPRKNFDGETFDELVASIKQQGVIQPILTRPVRNKAVKFEIVFGERRFRASKQAGLDTVPALIRDLDDETAFDLMTIENLQREDLNELEEARSFKSWLDKKGPDAVKELAERTGIDARYIRRRIRVLDLPKKILKTWEKGAIKYGHLEQLMRLKTKKEINKYYKGLFNPWSNSIQSVRDLKRDIDRQSPKLSDAKFDLKKTGCLTCSQNSDVQKTLWATDPADKKRCLNRKCFKQKQNNHLIKQWKKTIYYKKFKTTGFRFQEDVNHNEYRSFTQYSDEQPRKKCRDCPNFITIIDIDGDVNWNHEKTCFGDASCFNACKPQKKEEKKKAKDGPRVPWHGTHFREKFYETELPVRINAQSQDELKMAQIALFSLLKSNDNLHAWFAVYSGNKTQKEVEENPYCLWRSFNLQKIFDIISKMSKEQLDQAFREASIHVIMQEQGDSKTRHMIAEHFDIDLKTDWRITEEYLKKKTIKEMLVMGEKLEIFSDEKAKTFLYEKLLKKRGKFKSCKKAELIKVFLESGVDLTGKVPEEILSFENG